MQLTRLLSASALVALVSSFASPALADAPPPPSDPGEQAAEAPPSEEDQEAIKKSIEAQLKWQTGDVVIGDNLATLKLGEDWRYLDPKQAQFVLTDLNLCW